MLPDNVTVFTSLLFVFTAAIGGGLLAIRLKLPLIVGYIVMGILLGSISTTYINRQFLGLLSDVGITMLLFALGVEFSFQRLGKVLHIVGLAAVVQIIVVFLLVFVILLYFSLPFLAALFIAVAASLSSTAVAVKIFTQQGEMDTAYGEAAIAWLVIQDLAVVPIVFLLPAVVAASTNQSASYIGVLSDIALNMGKALSILLVLLGLGKYILPWILEKFARMQSREVFVIVIVSVVFLSAGLSLAVGLSASMGAFLAGLLVAETSQNNAIFSEIRPLRDIFSVIFFVSIGLLVSTGGLWQILPTILILSVLIVIIKASTIYTLSRFI